MCVNSRNGSTSRLLAPGPTQVPPYCNYWNLWDNRSLSDMNETLNERTDEGATRSLFAFHEIKFLGVYNL
jgi:hypothetical protein